jgi:carbamoyl-phosphate synthase large subunit
MFVGNILITSINNKIPLIKAVKNAAHRISDEIQVWGADIREVQGRDYVDNFWRMPVLDERSLPLIIEFCKEHLIRIIIPTRDGELTYWSKNREVFLRKEIFVMVSPLDSIRMAIDKKTFSDYLLKNHFNAIPTYLKIEDTPAPRIVVKERFGAGSNNIGLNLDRAQARAFYGSLNCPIVQPYIHGEEYSVDLYINREGTPIGVVIRKREIVIKGESKVTYTVEDPGLEEECIRLAKSIGFLGHVMFQVLKSESGAYYFLECNARFGGASTLSLYAGLDSFYWLINEVDGNNVNPSWYQKKKGKIIMERIINDQGAKEDHFYHDSCV